MDLQENLWVDEMLIEKKRVCLDVYIEVMLRVGGSCVYGLHELV